MKHLFFACLLLMTGCASTAPVTTDPTPSAADTSAGSGAGEDAEAIGTYYESALATLEERGRSAGIRDFQRLREAYVESPTYNPYLDPASSLVKSGLQQMDKKQWDGCSKTALEVIEINYTSLAGQYMGMICNLNAGNKEAGENHKFALNGLIEAIWSTGDGKTMDTAFHTYSTSELRTFLQLHGMEIVDQSLVRGRKGIFDVMKVKDPETGRDLKLYFNITKQWAKGSR